VSDIASLVIRVESLEAKTATKNLEGLTNAGGMVEGMVKKLAAAWAGLKLAEQVKESVLLAARYETLGVVMGVMGNNAGYTATQMAQFQQGLEATGISMVGARQSLNMMAAAQLNLAQSSDLARVAQDAAVISGTNSTEAFEALTRSIQTGMVVIAHRAGIMVNYIGSERAYAESIGKTKEQLTSQELAQARLNAVLEEGRKRQGAYEAAMTTSGKLLLSMERYTENLKVQFGNLFNPTLNAAVTALTGELKGTSDELTKLQTSGDMQIWGMKIRDGFVAGGKAISGTTKFLWEHRDAILALAAAYAVLKLIPMVNGWNTALTGWLANITRVVPAQRAWNTTLMTYTTTVEASTIATRAQAAASGLASSALTALTSPIGILISLLVAGAAAWYYFKDATAGGSKDAVQAANERIEEATRKLKAIQRAQEAIKGGDKSPDAGWLADDEWQVRKLTTAYGEAQSAVEKYRAAHERYVSAQGSKSVGSGTFAAAPSVDIGTARDELQYQNAQRHLQETMEARQKLVEVLNKEHAATTALEKERIKAGKASGDTDTEKYIGDPEKYTQYGKEIVRLKEEMMALTLGEEAAYKLKLKLMDAGAGGDTSKAQRMNQSIIDYKAQTAAWNAQDLWDANEKEEATRRELQAQTDYNKAVLDFRFAEEDAATKLADENDRVNASLAMQKALYAEGAISERQFTERVVELNKQLHVETSLFGDLRDTIQDWSKSSTDAFVEFCWTGKNSFGDLIDSMLQDLARLAVQKEIMDPLWGYVSTGISAWMGGSSGATSTTTDMGFGGTNDISGVSMPSYASSSKASASAQVSIGAVHINAATGTATTDGVSGGALAEKVSSAMREAALAVIVDEKRPGGHLEAVGAM